MPYVRRDAHGALVSLHRQPEALAQEWLDDTDASVQAFVGRNANGSFEQLDAEFIRVLEDLIDALLRRQLINITDFPSAALQKLYSRKGRRLPSTLSDLNLLGEPVDGEDSPLEVYSRLT